MEPSLTPCWRWLLDVLFGGSVLLTFGLAEFGIIPNHQGGFYCGDPTISFKAHGDTITDVTLACGSLIVPFMALWLVESCCIPCDNYKTFDSVKERAIAGFKLAVIWFRHYLFGISLVIFVTEIIKLVVGEPRPHFLDTCQPDKALNCKPGSYISNYTCTNKVNFFWDVSDSTKSFPSGHSSISFFTSLFLMWFIQVRVPGDITYFLVPWLHCLCSIWCLVCALTRITDHRHHWWDVLAGSLLGIIGAALYVPIYCGGFRDKKRKSKVIKYPRRVDVMVVANGHV